VCTLRTDAAEANFGLRYDTTGCDDYAACLARTTRATRADIEEVAGRRPVALEVFRVFGAKTYLIESNYFDADFRSEFSVVNLTSFTTISPDVLRVHFFGAPVNAVQSGAEEPLRDFVKRNANKYLGYTIIRPQQPLSSIGRSIIGVPRGSGLLRDKVLLANRIRTPVVENVSLFGVPLRAIGVPFMEQDANLLRCAHVVAWMAHFTAVLNGNVARRPSGSFNDLEGPVRLLGRAYPSPDISAWSLTHMLTKANLPPEVVTGYRLGNKRSFFWFDNPRFRAHIEELSQPHPEDLSTEAERRIRRRRAWIASNVTGTICRYLNSGIPCIYNFPGHSLLVCGYYRERDLPSGKPEDSSVAGFIVMDDQDGPYQGISVDQIVNDVVKDPDAVSVVIPLPTGLWLSGEAAELAGANVFARLIESVTGTSQDQEMLELDVSDSVVARLAPELVDTYTALREQISGSKPCEFSIRSYATHGTDFKSEFCDRLDHAESARIVGYATLPKFVWVVEVLQRDLHRQEGQAAVIATIVLDGSASSFDNMRPPAPLVLHFPGLIQRADDGQWHESRATAYRSGRWAQDGLLAQARQEARSHHFKWAT